MRLILASASPRRQQLLTQLNLPFEIQNADIDETPKINETPQQYVQRLALAKAHAIYQRLDKPQNCAILGADTSVIYQQQIFGKPQNASDAHQMLSQLSGKKHQVMTAIALIYQQTDSLQQRQDLNISQVQFSTLSDTEIQNYIATGEPFDKAGSYAIQGYAGAFITDLQGSYSGVMGLPLFETNRLLKTLKIG